MRYILTCLIIGLVTFSLPAQKRILLSKATVHIGNGKVIQQGLVGIEGEEIVMVENGLAYTIDKASWDKLSKDVDDAIPNDRTYNTCQLQDTIMREVHHVVADRRAQLCDARAQRREQERERRGQVQDRDRRSSSRVGQGKSFS